MLFRRCPYRWRQVTVVAFGAIISVYVVLMTVVTSDVTGPKVNQFIRRRPQDVTFESLKPWKGSSPSTTSHGLLYSPEGNETAPWNNSLQTGAASDPDKGDNGFLPVISLLQGGRNESFDSEGTLDENRGITVGKSGTVLLAGKKRLQKVEFSIGLVTVNRDKEDYFFSTLTSLIKSSSSQDHDAMTIVVMLGDRNNTYNKRVMKEIRIKFPTELDAGLLLVTRRPDTEFLFVDSLKRTYNDSLDRVRWRSKQNLDYAALMEFCVGLSVYYLHVEDDVLAVQDYLSHLRAFISQNAKTSWAMLEVCPHGFIGKLFRTRDLPKLVTILRTFYLEQPCDFLIKPYFINMMDQPSPILRKVALFFHQGKFSSLQNVTRKVDKIPKVAAGSNLNEMKMIEKNVTKGHQNPKAILVTDMLVYGTYLASNAYSPDSPSVFWASGVEEGQFISIALGPPVKLDRVVVETGYSDKVKKDILQHGTVEIGSASPADGSEKCHSDTKLGEFQDGRFDAHVTTDAHITCINIIANSKQEDWLVIRSILVYTKL